MVQNSINYFIFISDGSGVDWAQLDTFLSGFFCVYSSTV